MFGSAVRPRIIVAAWFTGFTMASLAIFYRRIPLSYLLFCFISLFLPLVKGLGSMPRYTVVLFPVFILFALLGKDKKVDNALTIIFCCAAGMLHDLLERRGYSYDVMLCIGWCRTLF